MDSLKISTVIISTFMAVFSHIKTTFIILVLILLTACEKEKTPIDYTVETLVQRLDSPRESDQIMAAYELSHYGQHAELAVQKLFYILQNGNWPAKVNAINTLSRIDTPSSINILEGYLPELVAGLSSTDFQAKLFAIQAIGYYGKHGVKALPELVKIGTATDKKTDKLVKKKDLDLAQKQEILAKAAIHAIEQIYTDGKTAKRL
jgi:hypothetical protein